MNSKNKNILVRIRVDEVTANIIRTKADSYFNGNMSACIRCATAQYNGESLHATKSNEVSALLTAVLRQLKKTGTNVNQIARQINERMKVSKYGLSGIDIQPFVLFRQDLAAIEELITQVKENL